MASYKIDKDGNASLDKPIGGLFLDAFSLIGCTAEISGPQRTLTANFLPRGTATITFSENGFSFSTADCVAQIDDHPDGKSVTVTLAGKETH